MKVKLDKDFVEKYFQSSDDEEELERQRQEKLRLKKKQNYYKKLKEKEKLQQNGNGKNGNDDIVVLDNSDSNQGSNTVSDRGWSTRFTDDDDENDEDQLIMEKVEVYDSDSDDHDFKPNAKNPKQRKKKEVSTQNAKPAKKSYYNYAAPIRGNYGPKKFQCDLCKKAPYSTMFALQKHRQAIHGIRPDFANISGKSYSTSSTNYNTKKYKCDLCRKAPYSTARALKQHKMKVHGEGQRKGQNNQNESSGNQDGNSSDVLSESADEIVKIKYGIKRPRDDDDSDVIPEPDDKRSKLEEARLATQKRYYDLLEANRSALYGSEQSPDLVTVSSSNPSDSDVQEVESDDADNENNDNEDDDANSGEKDEEETANDKNEKEQDSD